jgi:intraflagellar transport protein 172
MYVQKNMVNEAVRVCKKHCPHMLGDILESSPLTGAGAAVSGVQSFEEILDAAKIYEETGNYSRAIDMYLSINEESNGDHDRLEEVWENAVRLAMKHASERYGEIVGIIAKRLQLIQRFEAAAELYESVEAPREAVKCYMAGEAWDQAKLLAQQRCPDMLKMVEERHRNAMMEKGDADDLLKKTGDVGSALDLYARSGDWEKCLQLASTQGQKMLPHYLVQYAKILCNQGNILQACQNLVHYGPPPEPANFQLYKMICNDLLANTDPTAPQTLRELLLKLVNPNSIGAPPSLQKLADDKRPEASEFFKSLLSAHLQMLRGRLQEQNKGGLELIAKISVALCRYCAEFPMDKAFYDAGMDCKNANMVNMSFFFLNRFLDIADAIEDPENAQIDNTDFMDTDIPSPYDLDLPEEAHIPAQQVEEIRDVVLGWSMDKSVQQKMDLRPCDKCRTEIYTASLSCKHCKQIYEPCCITGFPVVKRNRVECTSCRTAANRDDWNAALQIFKCCMWCNAPQNPQF